VQYKAINVRTTENQIRAGFNIVNLTNNPANLSEFEIRYYFTRDTNDNSVTLPVACEFAVVGCAGVSLNVQPVIPVVNGVDSYLSVTFGSNNLPAGGSSGAVQIDVVKSDSSPFDQTNDFSFNATMMTYTESRHIALFRNGVLLWGTDPTLGAATLQAPTNGASNQPSHPVFQWSSVSSASRYQLRINNAGNSPVFQQWYNASDVCSGATCSVTPNVTLPNNTYSWWIETGTPAQNGPWSAGWSFRVGL